MSKCLLLVPSALSLLLALVLPHCQRFFVYDLQAVKDDFQVSAAPLALGEEKASLLSPICPPFCQSQCLIASQFVRNIYYYYPINKSFFQLYLLIIFSKADYNEAVAVFPVSFCTFLFNFTFYYGNVIFHFKRFKQCYICFVGMISLHT